jgi:hypothetical protein
MELLKSNFPMASMTIKDLYTENGSAAGTQVQLVIPILEKRAQAKEEV